MFGAPGIVAQANGFSVWQFVKRFKNALLAVPGSASSGLVLPRRTAKRDNLGTRKPVGGPVVAKWCDELDVPRMQAHPAGETALEADAPEVVLDARAPRMAA